MNWIDNREINYLQAVKEGTFYKFENEFLDCDSYYVEPQSDNYIIEYDFENMNQFGQLIQDVLKQTYNSKTIRVCEVAAMKCKTNIAGSDEANCEKEIVVPDFIYNF